MRSPIRLATIDDLSSLMEIESACFSSDCISSRQMRYLLTKAKVVVFVFQVGEKVVGYAMVMLPTLPRPARLYSLAVLPEFRGQKIAKHLLDRLLQYVSQKKYANIRLEVRASALDVQLLYSNFGFVKRERIANYYADGEAAFRMEKKLS